MLRKVFFLELVRFALYGKKNSPQHNEQENEDPGISAESHSLSFSMWELILMIQY